MTSRPVRSSGLPTRIRLTELIGSGESSEIWRARDTSVGADVVVKFLDGWRDQATTEGSLSLHWERVERESRALARLNDVDGIVGIREVGVAPDGTPWIVTPYVEGRTFERMIAEFVGDSVGSMATGSAPQRLHATVLIGGVLARALAAAHERDVVHGDISPSNIVVGADLSAHLIDFGMAALRDAGQGSAGIGGMTPAYAAPERLRGADADEPSDVYALAACLWHLLVGAPAGTSNYAAPTGVAGVDPAIRSDSVLLVSHVIEQALVRDPRRRPTAAELATGLSASRSAIDRHS